MRERFFGWYRRTPEELSTIWDAALFVPDANILLHCLRHPENVREPLLSLFEVLRDSLWIPYQVGLEFHRNRLDVEFGSLDAYDRIVKDCTALFGQARDRLLQLGAHPVINVDREVDVLDGFITEFEDRLRTYEGNHPTQAISEALDRLTDLLNGHVGEKWSSDKLKYLKKEGEERYNNKIPPGYRDSNKGDEQYGKYGDLIIWKDMIAKAKEEARPVIFISDDAKEDWWWIHRGKKLGPRPELIQEFKECTDQTFHIYQLPQFLRIAAKRYPEIKNNITDIEKSLLEDEQAKRHFDRFYRERKRGEFANRIIQLEKEREKIIVMLSGTLESGSLPQPHAASPALKARLAQIHWELQDMNNALSFLSFPDT